jgi:phage gpG-like protein
MFELRAKTWLDDAEVKARVNKAVIGRVQKCALLVEAEAKQLLSQGGGKTIVLAGGRDAHGRFLKQSETVYSPSAPGEPPHLRSGNLRNAIRTARSGPKSYVVGPQRMAWYGRVHEFGALISVTAKMAGYLGFAFGWWGVKPGSTIRIPKRPFMRPALLRCLAKFPALFAGLNLGGNVSK